MNYKEKFIKYKNKYKKLKNQYGGKLLTKEEIDNIKSQIINYETNSKYPTLENLNKFYDQELKQIQNQRIIDYVISQRTQGKKLMLIIGAIPTQKDNYIIPPNFVPIYLEKVFDNSWYNKSSTNNHKFIIKEILTKSFDEFPIIFYDILSDELGGYIELLELNIRFNLIIFDRSVLKYLDLTDDKINNLFRLTFDNKSLIVIEGFNSGEQISKEEFLEFYSNYYLPRCPISILQSEKIKFISEWFKLYFNNINIRTETYNKNQNINFNNECAFNFILENTITNNNNKNTTLLFYNQNIFYTNKDNSDKYLYLYLVKTKYIFDELPIKKNNIYVKCPHCNGLMEIDEINCAIFRHGYNKETGLQIPAHLEKKACDELIKKGLIYGCGKPFKVIPNPLYSESRTDEANVKWIAEKCDYI